MRKLAFIGSVIITVTVVCLVSFMAAVSSYGLEGDEVFSYISATSMGGFKKICFLEDQTWYAGSYFADALTATGDERFNLKMVWENQAMDTHPPLFYLFLNFICSGIGNGRFSPWFGIAQNMVFLIAVGVGLTLLLNYFLRNRYLSLFFSALFCCSRLAVDMVLFIRMYVLLMAFVVFQSWYHLFLFGKMIQTEGELPIKKNCRFYLLLLLITLFGALTHYYFLVYQFLIVILYIFALLMHRRYRDTLRYIGTMAASGVLYIVVYPAMLNHVFFKYRGREAFHKFLKEGTLFGDVISMLKLFDRKLFKGVLVWVLAALLVMTLILVLQKKLSFQEIGKTFLLIAPSLVYFFVISKSSPYVTIRYVSPVSPLLYTLIVAWAYRLLGDLDGSVTRRRLESAGIMLLLFFIVFYFGRGNVKEAYFAEKRELIENLAKETDYCVYVTADEYNWKMWEDYVNYPLFQGLFFIDGRYTKPIIDEKLTSQEKLVIFADSELDMDPLIHYLDSYLKTGQYKVVYETQYIRIISAE